MPRRALLALLAVVATAAGAWSLLVLAQADTPAPFRTVAVEEGPLTSAVTATGTMSALVTVEVGSQLSGQLAAITVDFNSQVTKGQVIARLNGDQLEARLAQARADQESARATLAMQAALADKSRADVATARAAAADAEAQVARAQLALTDTERDLARRKALRGRGVIATADLEKAETAMQTARAQLASARAQRERAVAGIAAAEASLAVADAQVAVARSQVAQKEAATRLVEVDIERSVIRAPIDGVVVNRAVNVGQTVAASLQAPTLFTIAQDLRQMEVLANIDEADIGRLKVGLPVTFTVAAYPGEIFKGTVTQVRLAPLEDQNVVTYVAVITVENPEIRLLPGMTANLRIVVEERANALKVPNAALRFRPPGLDDAARPPIGPNDRVVWVPSAQGAAVPVPVRLGIGDGSVTEVVEGDLSAGQPVIVGIALAERAKGTRLGF